MMSASYSQATDQELENKYWNYRDRFKKHFVQIGLAPGQSQIADWVKANNSVSDSFRIINGVETQVSPKKYGQHMLFGDAVVDHGYYLAALASEWRVLSLQGKQNTDQFRALNNELYFAIRAIDRLDENAELYLSAGTSPGNKNGFFIRSDHDEHFILRKNDIQSQKVEKIVSGGAKGPGILFVDSSSGIKVYDIDSFRLGLDDPLVKDPVAWIGGPGLHGASYDWGNEMSQDQCYGLFMGLTCIKNWVDGGLSVDPDGSDPTLPSKNLHLWISDITTRIVNHMSKTFTSDYVYADDVDHYHSQALEILKDRNLQNPVYFGKDTSFISGFDTTITWTIDSITFIVTFDTSTSQKFVIQDSFSNSFFSGSIQLNENPWALASQLYESQRPYKLHMSSNCNYIITNPVRNNKPVTRGHFATMYGYPIKEFAKNITGSSNFPDPYMELSGRVQELRWGANTVWGGLRAAEIASIAGSGGSSSTLWAAAHAFTIALPGLIADGTNDLDKQRSMNALSQVQISCPLLSPSPDLISACLIGRPLQPKKPEFWQDVWMALGTKAPFKHAVKGAFTANLIQNLALASGTWNKIDFENWADFQGMDAAELFYSKLHGGAPTKSRTYYQGLLQSAQCNGTMHLGAPEGEGDPGGYADFSPFNTSNLFSEKHKDGDGIIKGLFNKNASGVDYLLLYNLYKMASLEDWQEPMPQANFVGCPCGDYPSLKFASLQRSILEEEDPLLTDTISGIRYHRMRGFMPITTVFDDTITTEPIYNYYKDFEIRIPSFLLHDLDLNGYNGIPSRESILYCKNDLTICHSHTKLNFVSALETEASANPDFPTLVTVAKGSVLEVKNGAKIRINDNTRLIIEEGGKLLIHPGSQIVLNGSNAVLHIKGDVELKDNVTFEVLGGNAGKGFVLWESNYVDSVQTAHLIAGTNCKVEFTQNNTGIKALETRGNGGFETPYNLVQLYIHDCTVLIGNDSRLINHAKDGVFKQVAFRGNFGASSDSAYDFKLTANGVYQLGSKNLFKNTNFYTCKQGLTVFSKGSHYPLNLDNVNFLSCETGVRNDGYRIYWNGGEVNRIAPGPNVTELATYNSIFGMGQQGISYFQNVGVHMLRIGAVNPPGPNVDIVGMHLHGSGRNYLYKSGLNSGDIGVYSNQHGIYSWCSNYYNNVKQFALGTKSTLGIAGSRWNMVQHDPGVVFNKDYVAVLGMYELKLLLENGKNTFHGSSADGHEKNVIRAWIHPKLALTKSYSDPTKKALRARHNGWGLRPTAGSGLIPFPGLGNNSNIDLWSFTTDTNSIGTLFRTHINDSQHYNQAFGQFWETDRTAACLNMAIGRWNYGTMLSGWTGSGGGILNPMDAADQLYGGGTGLGAGDIEGVFIAKGNPDAGIIRGKLNDFYRTAVVWPLDYDSLIEYGQQLSMIAFPDSIALSNYDAYQLTQDLYTELQSDTHYSDTMKAVMAPFIKQKLINWSNALMIKSNEPAGNWRHFRFELVRDRALVHRHFEERGLALAWLDQEIPHFQKQQEIIELQNWRCLIATEQEYIDGNITIDDLFEYGCITTLVNENLNQYYNWIPSDFNSVNNGDDYVEEQEGGMPDQSEDEGNIIELEEGLIVYPNPSTSIFKYRNPQLKSISNIKVYSSKGVLIRDIQNPSEEGSIDLSSHSNGLYIITFDLTDKIIQTKVLLMK